MKLQSVDGALRTAQLPRAVAEPLCDDEAKLGAANCVAIFLQLVLALAGCAAVHWLMV